MQFRAVKGMNDILPDEAPRWQRLERLFRQTAELHGYGEVRTPVVEATALFVRSIGDTTDVVEKEMYSFERHHNALTLRPEGTAGAARAYVEHKVYAKQTVTRWYYLGPMFRAETPQLGRYRQFYQSGCEIYGDPGPGCDAEMIDMLVGFFRDLGATNVTACVNSIGSPGTRERYRAALLDFLRPKRGDLSDHAGERLEKNPLRILDSKDPKDQAACEGAPRVVDVLDEADRAHWDGLRKQLDALGTPYTEDTRLVRGLDYYTRTLFEIKAEGGELGAQNTLCGGGRYDGMIEELGGPSTPAIGFAMGLERILLATADARDESPPLCFVAPIGEHAQSVALVIGRDLRQRGIRAEVDLRGNSLKSMLRRADSLGARWAVVFGDAELDKGSVQLKNLAAHQQADVPRTELVRTLEKELGSA